MRALFSLLLLCSLMLTGCSQQTHTEIDWVNFIKWNGQTYSDSSHLVINDPSMIQDALGEVKFRVADNVHDPGYKLKDGDAAFLEPGTKFYAIKGYPQHDLIAVPFPKMPGGYQIYQTPASRSSDEHLFANSPRDQVQKVSIYLGNNLQNVLTGGAIQELYTLLDESKPYDFSKYDGAQQYSLVFHTDSPLGHSFGLVAATDGTFVLQDDVHRLVSNRIAELLAP